MTNRVFFDREAWQAEIARREEREVRREMAAVDARHDREMEEMKAETRRLRNVIKCRNRRAKKRRA